MSKRTTYGALSSYYVQHFVKTKKRLNKKKMSNSDERGGQFICHVLSPALDVWFANDSVDGIRNTRGQEEIAGVSI